jgi:hypothetical protein
VKQSLKTGNTRRAENYANLNKFKPLRPAKEGAERGQTERQTGVPDGGQTGAEGGARRGCLTGVPDGGQTGARRGARQGPDGG